METDHLLIQSDWLKISCSLYLDWAVKVLSGFTSHEGNVKDHYEIAIITTFINNRKSKQTKDCHDSYDNIPSFKGYLSCLYDVDKLATSQN